MRANECSALRCGTQVTDLYDPREQWASFLINALKAKELQARDVNYIVRDTEVTIVDEFTGRTMPGRRWGDGLHQVQPRCLTALDSQAGAVGVSSLTQACLQASGACLIMQRYKKLCLCETRTRPSRLRVLPKPAAGGGGKGAAAHQQRDGDHGIHILPELLPQLPGAGTCLLTQLKLEYAWTSLPCSV